MTYSIQNLKMLALVMAILGGLAIQDHAPETAKAMAETPELLTDQG